MTEHLAQCAESGIIVSRDSLIDAGFSSAAFLDTFSSAQDTYSTDICIHLAGFACPGSRIVLAISPEGIACVINWCGTDYTGTSNLPSRAILAAILRALSNGD